MIYSYEILPRPVDLGGGWRLRLLENGEEVGGGVFPPVEGIEDAKEALQTAFADAEGEAYAWLDSKNTEDVPADNNERQHRRDAVEFGLANVGLSGFIPSKEVQDSMRRFIDGDIELDEFIKGMMDHVKRSV